MVKITWRAVSLTAALSFVPIGCGAPATDTKASLPDASMPPDGGDAGPTFGPPIEVPSADFEKWVWVDIPEMRCSDDSPAGVVVNFTAQSRDLVIFFQGGGACWDGLTCSVQKDQIKPLQPDPLATWMADGEHAQSGIFVRDDMTNPLRRSNYVVIPYCTGDGHIGNKVGDYGALGVVHHVGYANVTAAIQRIVPTFLDAPQIVVSGFSAGGIGASGNYHQIASAFESVGRGPVVLINDAGPIMRAPFLSDAAQTKLRLAWGLDQAIDTSCPACATDGFHSVERLNAEMHPGLRGSLICAYDDSVVRLLYGALGSAIEGGVEAQGLADLADWKASFASAVEPTALREFYYFGDRHGAIEIFPLADTPGLAEFLTAQLDGSANWTSVRP
jgi:hypothetical protein